MQATVMDEFWDQCMHLGSSVDQWFAQDPKTRHLQAAAVIAALILLALVQLILAWRRSRRYKRLKAEMHAANKSISLRESQMEDARKQLEVHRQRLQKTSVELKERVDQFNKEDRALAVRKQSLGAETERVRVQLAQVQALKHEVDAKRADLATQEKRVAQLSAELNVKSQQWAVEQPILAKRRAQMEQQIVELHGQRAKAADDMQRAKEQARLVARQQAELEQKQAQLAREQTALIQDRAELERQREALAAIGDEYEKKQKQMSDWRRQRGTLIMLIVVLFVLKPHAAMAQTTGPSTTQSTVDAPSALLSGFLTDLGNSSRMTWVVIGTLGLAVVILGFLVIWFWLEKRRTRPPPVAVGFFGTGDDSAEIQRKASESEPAKTSNPQPADPSVGSDMEKSKTVNSETNEKKSGPAERALEIAARQKIKTQPVKPSSTLGAVAPATKRAVSESAPRESSSSQSRPGEPSPAEPFGQISSGSTPAENSHNDESAALRAKLAAQEKTLEAERQLIAAKEQKYLTDKAQLKIDQTRLAEERKQLALDQEQQNKTQQQLTDQQRNLDDRETRVKETLATAKSTLAQSQQEKLDAQSEHEAARQKLKSAQQERETADAREKQAEQTKLLAQQERELTQTMKREADQLKQQVDKIREDFWPVDFRVGPLAGHREQIETAASNGDDDARVLLGYVHVYHAAETSQVDSRVLRELLRDISRYLFRYLQKSQPSPEAAEEQRGLWAAELNKAGKNRFSISVPKLGQPIAEWMVCKPPGGTKVSSVVTWAVRDEKGVVIQRAEVI